MKTLEIQFKSNIGNYLLYGHIDQEGCTNNRIELYNQYVDKNTVV